MSKARRNLELADELAEDYAEYEKLRAERADLVFELEACLSDSLGAVLEKMATLESRCGSFVSTTNDRIREANHALYPVKLDLLNTPEKFSAARYERHMKQMAAWLAVELERQEKTDELAANRVESVAAALGKLREDAAAVIARPVFGSPVLQT